MKADDMLAIRALISRQFASLSWAPGAPADWSEFAGDFLPGALLYPAARPAQSQTVPAFIDRMKTLSTTTLRSLRERLLAVQVRGTAQIATAIAICEITENDAEPSRNVEMLLLVKTDAAWKIAAQCWDLESQADPVLTSHNF